jgi:predicted F0F1-ATPase subunit
MENSRNHQAWRATWRQALATLTVGWDLAIPIFGGVLGGHLLDRRLETGFAFTIGLLVLGLVVGVYNMARALQRELRRDQLELTGPANVRAWERTQESLE